MSLGQIIMYHNVGLKLKYPTPNSNNDNRKLADMSHSELKAIKEELHKQYGEIE